MKYLSLACFFIGTFAIVNANLCKNRCVCSGDPQCRNFDCENFDFMGRCTYDFATTHCHKNELPSNLIPFAVYQKQIPCSISNTTIVSSLEIEVFSNSYKLHYVNDVGVQFAYNGIFHPIPFEDSDGVLVYSIANGIGLSIPSGVLLEFTKSASSWSPKSVVQLPKEYAGHVCGLCGNFNKNLTDDFVDRKNNPVPLDNTDVAHQWYSWGSKWRNGPDFSKDSDGTPCTPFSSCGCSGDPHCYDFADNKFDTQGGEASYNLIATNCLDTFPYYLQEFRLIQHQVATWNKNESIINGLELDINSNSYKTFFGLDAYGEKVLQFNVNGFQQNLPYEDDIDGVKFSLIPGGIQATTNFGLTYSISKLTGDFAPRTQVELSNVYGDNVCGLCGSTESIIYGKNKQKLLSRN